MGSNMVLKHGHMFKKKTKKQGLDQLRKKMKPSGGEGWPSAGYRVMVTAVGQRGRQAIWREDDRIPIMDRGN